MFLQEKKKGNLLTMTPLSGNDKFFLEKSGTEYDNRTHHHCKANLNDGRLMITLHTRYSKINNFNEIYVEHPMVNQPNYLETALCDYFFSSTIIQFLYSGILQPGGKIYLPFHPYILKKLYRWNDGRYYKVSFDGCNNGLDKCHNDWVTMFDEVVTSVAEKFDTSSTCTKSPDKAMFAKDFENTDEKYFYDKHWQRMPNENFENLRWIIMTATKDVPRVKKGVTKKQLTVTKRTIFDESIGEDVHGIDHPYESKERTESTSKVSDESESEDEEEDKDEDFSEEKDEDKLANEDEDTSGRRGQKQKSVADASYIPDESGNEDDVTGTNDVGNALVTPIHTRKKPKVPDASAYNVKEYQYDGGSYWLQAEYIMEETFHVKAKVTTEGILLVSGLDKIFCGGEWKKRNSEQTVKHIPENDIINNRICFLSDKNELHPFETSKKLH